jgi:hypothetical protein
MTVTLIKNDAVKNDPVKNDPVKSAAPRPRLTFFREQRPVAMVVGHERSGVHFLMNALAACYEHVSLPHVDFDRHAFNINYFYPPEITRTLLGVIAARPLANVVKSHHAADFFDGQLPQISERFVLFYVYRDPVAVLSSFWRFIQKWQWTDGPKRDDPVAFAAAEPCGQMMRYQVRQHPSLMLRWAAHVEGWLNAAQATPRIIPVRYEDLDSQYEDTLCSFANCLGRQPSAVVRPPRDRNFIKGLAITGLDEPQQSAEQDPNTALRRLCEQTIGKTMARCGY